MSWFSSNEPALNDNGFEDQSRDAQLADTSVGAEDDESDLIAELALHSKCGMVGFGMATLFAQPNDTAENESEAA